MESAFPKEQGETSDAPENVNPFTASVDDPKTEGRIQAEVQEATLEQQTTEPTPQSDPAKKEIKEESFGDGFDIDYDAVKKDPNLAAIYSNMQTAYTQKTQRSAEELRMIEQVNAFNQNPQGTLEQLATQYGYTLNRAGQAVATPGEQNSQANWEPQNWEEVLERSAERASGKMEAMQKELQSLRMVEVRRELDHSCPDWQLYEPEMMKVLQKYPQMKDDPRGLYKMALPDKILEGRATKKALGKLQQKTDSSNITANRSAGAGNMNLPGRLNFAQSVEFARSQLDKQGIKPPA